MTTTNTFGVRFIARPRKTKPQELLLFARLTVRKKVAEISLKKTVAAECWDQANESIRGNKKLAFEFSNYLMKYATSYRKTSGNFKLKRDRLPHSH